MYKFQNHSILCMRIILAALMLSASSAHAQSLFTPEQHVRFNAKESTTLASVIQKYLTDQNVYQEIIALNPSVNPAHIHPKQAVILPRKWLRYTQTQAQVSYLRCNTLIRLKDSNTLLKTGTILKQGDVLDVPAQCQLSIQFQDESTIRMPSGGIVKISLLRTNPFELTPEVHIELLDGRIDVNISKKGRADGTFEVRTPKSVAGVRGTNFRVGFDALSNDGQVEVSKGLVSARGLSDKIGKSLPGQFGIAMSNTGKSGEVEPLPEATSLNSVQTQHDP
jgi:hypothetical protein